MEDGGETAFPVADMEDFNETVSVIDIKFPYIPNFASLIRSHELSCPCMEFGLAHMKIVKLERASLEKHLISRYVNSACQFLVSTWFAQQCRDNYRYQIRIQKISYITLILELSR